MKTTLLTLALVGGLTVAGYSQDVKPQAKSEARPQKGKQEKANLSPEDRAKNEAEHAAKEFTLTADQKTKWESASLARIKANQPLREKMKGSTTPEERKTIRGEAQANMQKFDKEVNSFLTAEQKTKWEAHKESKKQKMQKHKHNPDHMPDIED